jgi:hypothetical protein
LKQTRNLKKKRTKEYKTKKNITRQNKSKKWNFFFKKLENKQVERLTYCLFFSIPIIEDLHHLHKAMGKDSNSPWHKQHNERATSLVTQ